MCTTVYTEDAQVVGNREDFYLAPTNSRSFPIGVGLMEWDFDREEPVKVASYDESKVLSIEEATALRDALDHAIAAELAAPGESGRLAAERSQARIEAELTEVRESERAFAGAGV